jgi:hypothetical protein
MHRPLLVNGTAKDHPIQVVHKHLQHAVSVDAIPGRFTTLAQDRKKTVGWCNIVHDADTLSQYDESLAKILPAQIQALFAVFPGKT